MPDEIATGTLVGGRYRIEARIGEGTMGSVHRATREPDGRAVAIKIIPASAATEELTKRLEREGRALAALRHPHVLEVFDLGVDPLGTYLVTELATGVSLDDMLQRARLAPALALAIADQVISALAHAHEVGILHRDVKPGNVIVGEGPGGAPHAKLLDFGLAKFHDRVAFGAETTLTSRGTFVGTPAYVAPEQVFGPSVDARSDVYSAGVLLFELLTGSWPFVAEEVVDVLRAHALQAPPALSAMRDDVVFREELEELVARALAKNPGKRFADARELLAAFRALPRPAFWSLDEIR
ncbi:serine/threonine-protein kinase [Sandaracinus amylolyticus]|nr:serine/threonine-protein kinase [Sandaracinus amylolyticus]